MITISVDGHPIETEEGLSVLKTLRANQIAIPTLCYHPALKRPIASCKLCAVEVINGNGSGNGRKVMLACALKTKPGLVIDTRSPAVKEARTKAINELLSLAPQSEALLQLSRQYGMETTPPPDGCIRCRLCERVCQEIVGASALTLIKKNGQNRIMPVAGNCIGCGTCVNICPTKVIRIEDHENVRTIKIRDEIIGMHPLMRCEGCGALFATLRFLEHIHHRTLPHPDVKEHHQYCPSCAKLFRQIPSII